MRKQNAVYWEPAGRNKHGEEEYTAPVDIKCRWEDEMTQGFPLEGKETVFATMVYVDRVVKIGGLLRKGKIEDLKAPMPPPEDARRILHFEEIPDLRNKRQLLIAKF
jgi:hypothetical protein